MTTQPILPGEAIGVLGSGQLGRMFAIAAKRLGYRVHVFSPEADSPAGQIADREFVGDYHHLDQVREFARAVKGITFEFENVPSATAEAAAEVTRVRPAGRVLHVTQNRLREKTFFRNAGLPVTPFVPVHNNSELDAALDQLGVPAVLKTADSGYDGKGQSKVNSRAEAHAALTRFQGAPAILEAWVPFQSELSVVCVRGDQQEFAAYGPIENRHVNHILDVSIDPGQFPDSVSKEAIRIARAATEALDVVGLLCIEFFVTPQGQLLINEAAPRPHNSGHLTIEGRTTCQFEQQVRTLCGLPLGSIQPRGSSVMVNLLGDLWIDGEPNWTAALSDPTVKLHLYGKVKPAPGRKMGHLTVVAPTGDEALTRAIAARQKL